MKPAPEGFVVHTESTTSILFASPDSSASSFSTVEPTSAAGPAPVFLNPVQEYNRDLSVVAIRSWSEVRQREKRKVWEENLKKRREKKRSKEAAAGAETSEAAGKKRKAEDGSVIETEGKNEGETKEQESSAAPVEAVSLNIRYPRGHLVLISGYARSPRKALSTSRRLTNSASSRLSPRRDCARFVTQKRFPCSSEFQITLRIVASLLTWLLCVS